MSPSLHAVTCNYIHRPVYNVARFSTGFIEGWATDEKCLARQKQVKNRVLPVERVKYYELIQEGIDNLKNGSVRNYSISHYPQNHS